jgi:hypothetical protein
MAAPTDRVRLIIAVAALLGLTGCQDSLSRRDTVVAWAGNSAAANKAVHIIDPWPAASADTDIPVSGRRTVAAIERYEHALDAPAAGAPPAAPVQ